MELAQAPAERRREFSCSTCPANVRKQRRCEDPREDFTDEDDPFWPIMITKGGEMYSFCPGKSQWDANVAALYQSLVIATETGIMFEDGPLSEQPAWWIDVLSWFIPAYKNTQFWSRANAILGGFK